MGRLKAGHTNMRTEIQHLAMLVSCCEHEHEHQHEHHEHEHELLTLTLAKNITSLSL